MKNSNIETISDNIICQETRIQLTDEKLKSQLSKVYEQARKDASRKKWYSYFDIAFSIFGTLLIALLTANFNSILGLESDVVTSIAWVIVVISFLYGIVGLFFSYSNKNNSSIEHEERDKAVNEILNKEILNNTQK